MNKEQTLSEWDRISDVSPAEEYAKDAEKRAAMLIGQMALIARDKDKEEDLPPESITLLSLIAKHKEFWLTNLAKRYQTLINEGKI